MKILKQLILLVLITSCFPSCYRTDKNGVKTTKEFYLSGKVNLSIENGIPADKVELSLTFEGDSTHIGYTSVVHDNGEFVFKGDLRNTTYARLMMRNDLINTRSAYPQLEFILEPDTIDLILNISFDENDESVFSNYRFDSIKFGNNNVNAKLFDDLFPTYLRTIKDANIQSSNPVIKDSLEEFVYPTTRIEVFNFIDSLKKTDIDEYAFNYLIEMINFGATETRLLSQFQANSLVEILENFDSSLTNTSKFKLNHKRLTAESSSHEFYDGYLQNITGTNFKLDEIIKRNEHTVLYFWNSGCGPCRKFNKNFSPDLHKQLSDRNIEIVSINTDLSKELWEKTSKTDSIYWTNLFVGHNSQLSIDYEIQFYPTKIIFDNDNKRVDFKYTNTAELLSL